MVVLLSASGELATTFNNSCSTGVDLIKQKRDIESIRWQFNRNVIRFLFVLRKKDIYLRPHCALPMRSANTLPLNVICVAVVVDQLSVPLQRGIVNDCECKLMRLLDNLGRVWVIKR